MADSPMLFLHGVGRRGRDFFPFALDFESRVGLQILDLSGHGEASRTGRYRAIDYLDRVLSTLEDNPEPTIIYGHSLGALLAGAAAATRPESVRAIVLEDPPGRRFYESRNETAYPTLFRAMQRLASNGRSVAEVAAELAEVRLPRPDGTEVRFGDVRDADALRFSAECLIDLDPQVYSPFLDGSWLNGFDAEAIWRKVRCPTLLFQGDTACGGMLLDTDAAEMAEWIPDNQTVRFPGIGHLIHWTATELAQERVHEFLNRVAACS